MTGWHRDRPLNGAASSYFSRTGIPVGTANCRSVKEARKLDSYSSGIHASRLSKQRLPGFSIFKLGEITGLPMTVIIDQAIREYLGKYETGGAHHAQVNDQDE